jgi:type II secretory ATPase GspE/PulE/Tfp pilus assembly ATPase PilB-like protein
MRGVHWRTADVATEHFVQIRDNALVDRNLGEDAAHQAHDESAAALLRVCDYNFIMSFKASRESTLPEPQRPEGQMRQHGFLPVGIAHDAELDGDAVYVLVKDREPASSVPPYLRHDVWERLVVVLGGHIRSDLHVVLLGTGGRVVQRAIEFFYYQVDPFRPDDPELPEIAEPLSIAVQSGDPDQIKQARFWLREAVNSRASDVHLEPGDGTGRLRMRIDGVLVSMQDRVSSSDLVQVITWIKAQSNMDIAERRRPQDGHMRLALEQDGVQRHVDVRVSTIRTIHGEKMVLRLLDPEILRGLASGGLQRTIWNARLHARYIGALESRDGIVLVTGPTGSGKTTTLNSSLFHLIEQHGDRRNIVTIEDPVEYNVKGVNQIQVNEQAEVTFAVALRSILRQDPDIVLVGEIRDDETARIAIQAALTGHLILATLHTNDALGSVDRLGDLGASPFLTASTVRLFQAQRLVRLLCPHCGRNHPLDAEALRRKVSGGRLAPHLEQFTTTAFQAYEPSGCARCNYTGYAGRKAVMEMAVSTHELIAAIERKASAHELGVIARRSGYRPMVENGIELVAAGETSLGEIEAISLSMHEAEA